MEVIAIEKEVFKDIPGYEGRYSISNMGRVKSRSFLKNCGIAGTRLKPEIIMTPVSGSDIYHGIILCVNNKKRRFKIHRLIAQAFIPNPERKPCVNHIDGNRLNNSISNLEWCTYSENNFHKYRVLGKKDIKPTGEEHWKSRPVFKMDLSGNIINRYFSLTQACLENGVHRSNVIKCINGKYLTSGGFKWKYDSSLKEKGKVKVVGLKRMNGRPHDVLKVVE